MHPNGRVDPKSAQDSMPVVLGRASSAIAMSLKGGRYVP